MNLPIIKLYFDQDGPLADCDEGLGVPVGHPRRGIWETDKKILAPMYKKGFFRNLKVTEGAKEAVADIMAIERLNCFVATHPIVEPVAFCASEKYDWLKEHFPALLTKTFMACDKSHLNGHYLIDDHKDAWEASFQGTFLHFDIKDPLGSWQKIVSYLQKYDPKNLPNQVKKFTDYPCLVRQMKSHNPLGMGDIITTERWVLIGKGYVKKIAHRQGPEQTQPELIRTEDCFGMQESYAFDEKMRFAEKGCSEWQVGKYRDEVANGMQ